MSIFKVRWIILKISKAKEKDFIYDVFCYEFWKIKIQKKDTKREKTLDLWYIANFEIETKQDRNIHKARNIKLKSEFCYENKEFKIINSYLSLIWIILNKIPDWVEFKEIFDVFEEIHKKENIDETKLILSWLKIINCLWELDVENEDIIIDKILNFINKNKIKEILKLTGINTEQINILKNILSIYQ